MDNQEIKALLPIEERGDQKLVDARMLHEFLGVKNYFRNWIKDRIEKYDFREDEDYVRFRTNSCETQGGRPAIDYGLTLDMAKELAMVENNARGREARRYFIACEKIAQKRLPASYPEALRELAASEEEKLRLTAQNQELSAHLADTAEEKQALQDITKPHGFVRIKDAAKIISYPGLGQNNMFKFLRKHKFLIKIDRGDKSYTFHQKYAKYFKERPTQQTGGHEGMPYTQVVINMDGVSFLHRKILKVKGPWRGMKTKEELIAEFSEKEEL